MPRSTKVRNSGVNIEIIYATCRCMQRFRSTLTTSLTTVRSERFAAEE
jgi:hypothetical protein